MNDTPPQVIITSAPPNPNGDLHLGHLSGPFLGADVLRRYLRQRGHEVSYVSYADDFSCYVPRRGHEINLSAHQTAHVFGRRMEETLGLANMTPDYFMHPLREPVQAGIVQRFFLELWDKGAFEVVELPVFWCPGCHRYLYEAEIRGRCQYCSAPSDGFYCEECGRPQETTGLRDPRCTACHREPDKRTLPRITIPLERHRSQLRTYFENRPMRPRLREYLDDMFSRPLPRTTVARLAAYGIPVPMSGWDGYILDTWYSGIWGYLASSTALAAAKGTPDEALLTWSDPTTRIYEFIGYDCGFSHAILWPALFLAHGGLRLPDQVVTNEFYRLEGDKFSTSRGHAIWGNEVLRRVSADQLRFYLALTGPERAQTSFSEAQFEATTEQLLVQGLQRWAQTVIGLAGQDFHGVVPAAPSSDGPLAKLAATLPAQLAASLDPDDFSPQAACAGLRDAIKEVVVGLDHLKALRHHLPTAYAADLALHLNVLAHIAATSAPIMPAFAEHAWTVLGLGFRDPVARVIDWPADGVTLAPGPAPVAPKLATLFHPVA